MTAMANIFKHDVHIVIGGEAGQGINTVEAVLVKVFKLAGYHVFATKEYMSRVRGGSNSTSVRISSERVSAPRQQIDLLIPLDQAAIPHVENRLSEKTVIIGEQQILHSERKVIDVPFSKIAREIGLPVLSNIVAVGVIASICGVAKVMLLDFVTTYFAKKDTETIHKNQMAAERGFDIGQNLVKQENLVIQIPKDPSIRDEVLLNGAEAIGLGAIAGGCHFIASYPMSPSTGVLTFLSSHAREFDIIAEQAEDEISAINMALGASYAGARAMVTTSGGGFALMEEGVSLSGMTEIPVVIHLAQRPGPATGLPTRTEQADLELALYSGHGEFPRIIFTPGTIQDMFTVMPRAFNLAENYQVPVFVLTDQYLIDSYYNIPIFNLNDLTIDTYIIKTDAAYKRYQLTDNGISPRGIPGYGEGLVLVDSDEHNEDGRITEDLDLRIRMDDKRRKKLELICHDIEPPEFVGPHDYRCLIIGWGSTYGIIKEALAAMNRDDTALLHFRQVYPVHSETINYLKQAQKLIIVENNATAQFAKLLKLATGIAIETTILKYNGLPFFVEELVEQLQNELK
jgi:2-oxoglutarate ferredoxin oxidoreductase subunit alpha